MTTVTQADLDALNEAEVSEAAALSLRKQAETFEADALAIRAGVYAAWAAQVPPPIDPPIDPPPVDPPVYDTLPALKSGAAGAVQVYDFTGKRFNVGLNVRRMKFIDIIGGEFNSFSEANGAQAFYADEAEDINVTGAIFKGAPPSNTNYQRCRVRNSKRVIFDGCVIIGGIATTGIPQDQPPPLASGGNVIGLPTGEGINFSGCTDCALLNSETTLCHQGVTFGGSTLRIIGNFVHEIRTSPFSGTPKSGMVFTHNRTIAGKAWMWGVTNGDHADACHFFTDGTGDVDGMIFEDNVFEQGNGSPTLGVNHQAKTVNGVQCGYTNLQARRNTINIACGQGWRVDGCSGIIEDTVLLWPGDHSDPKSAPRLDINAPSHDLAVNGTVGLWSCDTGLTNVTVDGALQP